MSKIHTRFKRKFGLNPRLRHRYFFSNIVAKKGAKSFRSAEDAQAWAKEQGVDTKEYVLYEVGSKFQWRLPPRE